jgi:DNA-binding beta-propeller fold protein YncE
VKLACVAVWLLASGAGLARADGLAFVINSGDASMSLLDVTGGREIRRIPVLREPHHMALSPDGRSLLVGDTVANEVFFYDPVTAELQRRVPISDPYQLQFSPNGKLLVVTGLARNQIDIYDAGSLKLLHRLPIAKMPSHINFKPDSSVAYISLQESNRLVAVDMASGGVIWNVAVGKTPAGVLWHDGRILVGIMGENDMAVVDPADGHVERRVVTGRGAHNLFVAPDGRTLYVCNRVDGTISLLDPRSLAVRGAWRVPGGPDDLDFAPDGTIWVTRRFAHSVALIDPATGQFRTIEVGRSPHGIWLNTHMATPARVAAVSAK